MRRDRRTLKWHDRRIWPFIVFGVGISTAGAVPIQTIGYLFIDVLHYSPKQAPQYTGIGLVAGALAALFAQLVVVQRFDLSARTLDALGQRSPASCPSCCSPSDASSGRSSSR